MVANRQASSIALLLCFVVAGCTGVSAIATIAGNIGVDAGDAGVDAGKDDSKPPNNGAAGKDSSKSGTGCGVDGVACPPCELDLTCISDTSGTVIIK